jgi:hypothetical protein
MKSDKILKEYGYTTKVRELNTLLKIYAENFDQYQHTTNESIKNENYINMMDAKERLLELL